LSSPLRFYYSVRFQVPRDLHTLVTRFSSKREETKAIVAQRGANAMSGDGTSVWGGQFGAL
jgi:hypothetical protein